MVFMTVLVVFLLCFDVGLFVLYIKSNKIDEGAKEVDEEEERKAREKNEHYENMLNYNATQAYGGTHG